MKRSALSRISRVFRPACLEALEARIAPAGVFFGRTLYVDNPEDFTITNDTGAPGLSEGDEVTWNPGFFSLHGGPVTQLTFGTQAFSSINSAIDAAVENDVIRVGPGNFFETIVVDKTVTLLGNEHGVAEALTAAAEATGLRAFLGASTVTLAADNVVLDGFTITGSRSDAPGATPLPAVQTSAAFSGYQILNNDIGGGTDFENLASEAINLASNGEFLTVVARNKLVGGASDTTRAPALAVTEALANAHIVGNTIHTTAGTGIYFEPATGAGSDPVVIGRNTFVGVSNVNGRGVGVVVGMSTSEAARLSISENIFLGQQTGIVVQSIPATTDVIIRSNHFSVGSGSAGPTPLAITSSSSQTIDARYNWFGTWEAPEVDALVSGNVDFEPFLTTARDSRLDIPGLQSVPTLRIVSDRVATLLDVDGDTITVSVSKGVLDPSFFNVQVDRFSDGVQLQELFLGAPMFQGANVSITGKRSAAGGDNTVNVGSIYAAGVDLGTVVVGGDLGAIQAGNAAEPADAIKVLQTHSIGRFAERSLPEGATPTSFITGALGSLNVRGNIEHAQLVLVDAWPKGLGTAKIGGSLIGGSLLAEGNIGNVTIRGNILGGMTTASGGIFAEGKLGNVTVGGSLIATAAGAEDTAFIRSTGDMGFVKIGGDVIGGAKGGARIFTDDLTSGGLHIDHSRIAGVTIGGSLIGGTGGFSGVISADGPLGPVRIGGDVRGVASEGMHDAEIIAADGAASITIGGSLIGQGWSSGNIHVDGKTGPIAIKGSIVGEGEFSGNIRVSNAPGGTPGGLSSLTVGGSIMGGQVRALVTGSVTVEGPLGPVKIGGSLIGGSAAVAAEGVTFSGAIRADKIASIAISGSLIAPALLAGTDSVESASIAAAFSLGPVTIGGDMLGTAESRPQIIAGGLATGLTIASVKIRGDIIFGRILAGYSPELTPMPFNPHAQIGAVTVGGDWIASDLAAGVETNDGFFGNSNDIAIPTATSGAVSKIASLTVKGTGAGSSSDPTDHFGIVAREIGKVTIGGIAYPLTPGAGNDLSATNPLLLIGATNDFRVREVTVT